ncbi:hypothetical protein [Fluviibacterium sp. S390]|uniref:hypothetical protein n=1 Tax=Fluviibacterium sp. S390 TaxID=3415139 RepID=UPI003C7A96CA
MPTFDTGHLFLTFLSPIKHGSTSDPTGAIVSHEQLVRATLGLLPTALQSPATQKIGENSPFARNRMTHLCRMFVLEDAVFNGRNPVDAICESLQGKDPINPQRVDRLNCAYLVFCADVDAVMDEGESLPEVLDTALQARARDAYLRKLWTTMEPELRLIYGNCTGFDGVDSGASFAAYMAKCQIETTMPFNDYWISQPELSNLPTKPMLVAAAIPAAITLLGLIGGIFGMDKMFLLGWLTGWSAWGSFFWGGLVTAAVVYGLYRYVLANGQKPMPPAKYGDLPSVLKSLYLQQHFANFVIDQQGRDADTLHADFGDFLKQHRPGNKMAPSQAPGVISIDAAGGVIEG